MKKLTAIILCLVLALALAACGAKSTSDADDSTPDAEESTDSAADSTADAAESTDSAADSTADAASTQQPEPTGPVLNGDPAEGVDVDLTVLSGVMVYSEVYNMMQNADAYMGLVIKVGGTFSVYHDDNTGNDYYYLFVKDAGACCAQGIEFKLTDDKVYPDDYPQRETYAVVIGTFDVYQEGEYRYFYLKDARLAE